MNSTKLKLQDKLPLTCSRKGTCCHGNRVYLNPWELVCIAKEKQLSPREFRDLYCESGGILLSFNGKVDHRGKPACSQYIENFGCSVHEGRPLACRLFPLGRQIQSEEVQYIYEGDTFPCLNGCPEVVNLPSLSVGDYLEGQLTESFEQSQDAYLELMQNIADIAFTLLLDTGLAETGETKTLSTWRELGKLEATELANRIGNEWLDILMLPTITDHIDDPVSFAQIHNEQLQLKAQENFGQLDTMEGIHEVSVLMMALALYLARALGADPKILSEHWIEIAKSNGA
jgi:Fe-S-cluster containining protein